MDLSIISKELDKRQTGRFKRIIQVFGKRSLNIQGLYLDTLTISQTCYMLKYEKDTKWLKIAKGIVIFFWQIICF